MNEHEDVTRGCTHKCVEWVFSDFSSFSTEKWNCHRLRFAQMNWWMNLILPFLWHFCVFGAPWPLISFGSRFRFSIFSPSPMARANCWKDLIGNCYAWIEHGWVGRHCRLSLHYTIKTNVTNTLNDIAAWRREGKVKNVDIDDGNECALHARLLIVSVYLPTRRWTSKSLQEILRLLQFAVQINEIARPAEHTEANRQLFALNWTLFIFKCCVWLRIMLNIRPRTHPLDMVWCGRWSVVFRYPMPPGANWKCRPLRRISRNIALKYCGRALDRFASSESVLCTPIRIHFRTICM